MHICNERKVTVSRQNDRPLFIAHPCLVFVGSFRLKSAYYTRRLEAVIRVCPLPVLPSLCLSVNTYFAWRRRSVSLLSGEISVILAVNTPDVDV